MEKHPIHIKNESIIEVYCGFSGLFCAWSCNLSIYISIYVGWWYASFQAESSDNVQIHDQPITKPLEQAQTIISTILGKNRFIVQFINITPESIFRPKIFTFQFTTGNINPVPSQRA